MIIFNIYLSHQALILIFKKEKYEKLFKILYKNLKSKLFLRYNHILIKYNNNISY